MPKDELSIQDQKKLGKPLGIDPRDTESLESYISMLEKLMPTIDFNDPTSLLNKDVYDSLNDQQQGLVDMKLGSMLAALAFIQNMYREGMGHSAETEYYVNMLKHDKEQLENKLGVDVLKL